MVENENLVAQNGEAVQVVGALVVLDGGDRGLKLCDVRFERDGQAVAEPPLGAIAEDPQKPGGRRRRGQADRR